LYGPLFFIEKDGPVREGSIFGAYRNRALIAFDIPNGTDPFFKSGFVLNSDEIKLFHAVKRPYPSILQMADGKGAVTFKSVMVVGKSKDRATSVVKDAAGSLSVVETSSLVSSKYSKLDAVVTAEQQDDKAYEGQNIAILEKHADGDKVLLGTIAAIVDGTFVAKIDGSFYTIKEPLLVTGDTCRYLLAERDPKK
jgi:hypothetical protein